MSASSLRKVGCCEGKIVSRRVFFFFLGVESGEVDAVSVMDVLVCVTFWGVGM